jgi:hypothetical protein
MKQPICSCGCGRPIPWKAHHKYRPPRFLPLHSSRIKRVRINLRCAPPPGMTFSGLCACGCGEHTRIAKTSRPKNSEYRGYPQRYVHGHHSRGKLRERSTRWKGGRNLSGHGYWRLYLPDHPSANKSGYVLEHRLVWETEHGQQVPNGCIVHHRDGNKTNNAIDNLELMPFRMHQSMHAKVLARTQERRERCRILAKQMSAMWLDPEIRKRRLAGLSERAKKQWKNPEQRSALAASMRTGQERRRRREAIERQTDHH